MNASIRHYQRLLRNPLCPTIISQRDLGWAAPPNCLLTILIMSALPPYAVTNNALPVPNSSPIDLNKQSVVSKLAPRRVMLHTQTFAFLRRCLGLGSPARLGTIGTLPSHNSPPSIPLTNGSRAPIVSLTVDHSHWLLC